MLEDVDNEKTAFLDIALALTYTLAHLQKTLMELESLLRRSSALRQHYTVPCDGPSLLSTLDCSAYFEPLIDPTLLTFDHRQSAEYGAPDLSDYFEPVAPYQPSQRILQ
jgi:hypothetical protein